MKLRKLLIVSLVVLVVIWLGVWGAVWWCGDQAWAGMLVQRERVQKDVETAPRERPVLWGESRPGDAREDYAALIELLRAVAEEGIPEDRDRPVAYWMFPPVVDLAKRREALDPLASAMARVRVAAHKTRVGTGIVWSDGLLHGHDGALVWKLLGDAMRLRTWELLEADEDLAAVHMLLDEFQMFRDQVDNPLVLASLIGLGGIRECAKGFFFERHEFDGDKEYPPMMSLGEFSDESKRALAAGLEILDRPMAPLAEAVRVEAALSTYDFAKVAFGEEGLDAGQGTVPVGFAFEGGWRFGGSLPWMVADHFEVELRLATGLPPESAPWSEWSRHCDGVDWQALYSRNGVYKVVGVAIPSLAKERRKGLVPIRVLRMLVAEALGEKLDLEDPFGGKLMRGTVDGRSAYWSRGPDGVDDGGQREKKKDLVYTW